MVFLPTFWFGKNKLVAVIYNNRNYVTWQYIIVFFWNSFYFPRIFFLLFIHEIVQYYFFLCNIYNKFKDRIASIKASQIAIWPYWLCTENIQHQKLIDFYLLLYRNYWTVVFYKEVHIDISIHNSTPKSFKLILSLEMHLSEKSIFDCYKFWIWLLH